MAERILVCVAWPYANGSLHLGHVAGATLPADIFAKYHWLKGNEVIMVSGTDQHGTPITFRAEQEGVTPQVIVDRYHKEFLECWKGMDISFDIFTTTGTKNHEAVVQDIFLNLHKKGYIYKGIMLSPYCPVCKRYLSDRYVEGTCPHCGYAEARGDQCDKCGRTLDPKELIGIKCRLSGDTPEIRETEHFFLKLSAFQQQLSEWVTKQTHWRPNVLNFTLKYLESGLKDRAITRDLEWGIPIPLKGYDDKRIYVWFEAVIGYLSSSVEWSKAHGKEDAWKGFWKKDCRSYYFMGKDNIAFHTIIWPAMLMGYGGLNLPYDVAANEFLTLDGKQFSTSRNWAVWLPDYLKHHAPDPLRYYLSANMPESSDADFTWKEYIRRNNDELLATYGNLVHRVATLAYRHYEGKVPKPGPLTSVDQQLLNRAKERFAEVGNSIELCKFRTGIAAAMSLAQEANRYLDTKAPWKTVKVDSEATATTLWVALSVINCLKSAFHPYLPFTSRRLHKLLGFKGEVDKEKWEWNPTAMAPGQPLPTPEPLFTKLDEELVEGEAQRVGGSQKNK